MFTIRKNRPEKPEKPLDGATTGHVLDELKAEISKLEASLPKTMDAYIKKDRQICILDLIYQTLTYECGCTALWRTYSSWSDKEEKIINDAKEKYGHLVSLEVKKLDNIHVWLHAQLNK